MRGHIYALCALVERVQIYNPVWLAQTILCCLNLGSHLEILASSISGLLGFSAVREDEEARSRRIGNRYRDRDRNRRRRKDRTPPYFHPTGAALNARIAGLGSLL